MPSKHHHTPWWWHIKSWEQWKTFFISCVRDSSRNLLWSWTCKSKVALLLRMTHPICRRTSQCQVVLAENIDASQALRTRQLTRFSALTCSAQFRTHKTRRHNVGWKTKHEFRCLFRKRAFFNNSFCPKNNPCLNECATLFLAQLILFYHRRRGFAPTRVQDVWRLVSCWMRKVKPYNGKHEILRFSGRGQFELERADFRSEGEFE